MEPLAKIKNVGRGEGIFRSAIGVILIILAFPISGFSGWVLGTIGVLIILTAIFGY
jgi:hypothetical protein